MSSRGKQLVLSGKRRQAAVAALMAVFVLAGARPEDENSPAVGNANAGGAAVFHLLRAAQCDAGAMTDSDRRAFVQWTMSTPEGSLVERHDELLTQGFALEETDAPAVQWALSRIKRRCLGAPQTEKELLAKVEIRQHALQNLPPNFTTSRRELLEQIDRHRSMFAHCQGVTFEYPEIKRHEQNALNAEYPLALLEEAPRTSAPDESLELARRIEAAMPRYSAITAFALSQLYLQTNDREWFIRGLAYAELARRIILLDRVPDHAACADAATAAALMPTADVMEIESMAEDLYSAWAAEILQD